MTGVLERLRFIAELVPAEQIAVADDQAALTYPQLIAAIASMSEWLAHQSARVVAIQADNGIPWLLADLACQVTGKVALPIPGFFQPGQVQHCLKEAGAELLLSDEQPEESSTFDNLFDAPLGDPPAGHQQLQPLYASRLNVISRSTMLPVGTGKITFTSGSTGTPKGVCLSTDHQWQVAESLAEVIHLKSPRHLCLLPLATLLENVAGIYAPLLSAGTVLLPSAKVRGLQGSSGLDSGRLLATISQQQPNSLILIPQLLMALTYAARLGWQPPTSLRFIAVGGARVAPGLIDQARQLGLPVYEGYGLSECGSVVALNTPSADQPGSVGQILPHCQVSLEEGEVWVSGASFLGYVGDPASWYPEQVASGDLGELEGERLTLYGRRKNLLITAFGRNVSPEWIESELHLNPAIRLAVVVGDGRSHLSALINSDLNDQALEEWLATVNSQLPDYAQVKAWLRVAPNDWQGLLTDNGRPRRDRINQRFAELIDGLYLLDEALLDETPLVEPGSDSLGEPESDSQASSETSGESEPLVASGARATLH
ncbi:AMP-binding protein [Halioxenophilus sp. WMMB6]|uniref:AMP-binding protein n=1 Tax=Halioxenophilus sp. WMMB6 TaxID=3073815 RepID=UPI00295EFD13|nr:AMP-binding protein [Halioxenophilus sp. WMMB6]